MALPLYLAMTAAEMRANKAIPDNLGYMACHFSPYGTGLSNCPKALPEGAMLIVNDRTPICAHDKRLITNQLVELVQAFQCGCVLLDFQRGGVDETGALVRDIVGALPCPVGVSECYAEGVECPVFLPPVPSDVPVAEYLQPWAGREVWLEAALDGEVITLTEDGSSTAPLPPGQHPEGGHRDGKLHCHYHIHIDENAKFTLFRTQEDLEALLAEAEVLGTTRTVGLWQELGR